MKDERLTVPEEGTRAWQGNQEKAQEIQPLISVIVPVFNAEKYLDRSIRSICDQTYHNLEIILIDDGSTDRSGSICDECAKNDRRVRVIHKENGGVSSARNAGLDAAAGEYICFVDADDIVLVDYVRYLYLLLTENESDISVCGFVRTAEDEVSTEAERAGSGQATKLSQQDAIELLLYKQNITGYVYVKLFKRDCIKNIRFEETLRVAEDFLFVLRAMKNAEKVVYGDIVQYLYIQNPDSCMHDNDFRKYRDTWQFLINENWIENESETLRRAYQTYLFICGLGFYAHSQRWQGGESFLNELVDGLGRLKANTLRNKRTKITHRILALFCMIHTRFGCELAKCVVSIQGRMHIQLKHPV